MKLLREVRHLGRLGRVVPERRENGLRAQCLLDLEALQDGEEAPLAVPGQGQLLAQLGPPAPLPVGLPSFTPAS